MMRKVGYLVLINNTTIQFFFFFFVVLVNHLCSFNNVVLIHQDVQNLENLASEQLIHELKNCLCYGPQSINFLDSLQRCVHSTISLTFMLCVTSLCPCPYCVSCNPLPWIPTPASNIK